MKKGNIANIKDIQIISDKDCHCSDEEQETADCDNCEIHKASNVLNEIGDLIDYYLRDK